MTISGRRPTGRASRIGKGLLDGLAAVSTAMADSPKRERIAQIDIELERLQHEKDTLILGLIEPGDLKVSEGYDPRRAAIINNAPVSSSDGRLTNCEGQWSASSTIHNCHPACPYLGTKHIAHEFTLRD